ncbi:hypothetical protein RDWZM_001057 [Blomia tropicalis]|uniref:DNA repair protein complementing XP-C cells-like protein n=1 Tax=Blomia tropicalis TaxID=40697 RepID=A0A9Q0MDY1_BLOTA|nr:hypothetical protein RDWZM_001057 [Blomia tropicalis]
MSKRQTRSCARKSPYFNKNKQDNDDEDDESIVESDESSEDYIPEVEVKTHKRKSNLVVVSNSPVKKQKTQARNEKSGSSMKAKRVEKSKKSTIKDRNNNKKKLVAQKSDCSDDVDSDDDNEDDWEEVEDAKIFDIDDYKPDLPENIKITLDQKTKKCKTERYKEWLDSYIRQSINRMRKQNQINRHKCNILFLINRLVYLNRFASENSILRGLIASIFTFKHNRKDSKIMKLVPKMFESIKKEFTIKLDSSHLDADLNEIIMSDFQSSTITSSLTLVLILLTICRWTLKVPTRLCHQLNVISIKPSDLLLKTKKKSNGASGSSSQCDESPSIEECNYFWIEVFDKEEKKWICFDLENNIINEPHSIGTHLGKDVTYVLAVDEDDYITDVTARYAADYVSYAMKKRRPEDDWWDRTMKIIKRPECTPMDDADRKEFDEIMSRVELPKRLSEYKNHPLFVLERDILKFQAIYPSNAPPLGFYRDQPVYARECVHVLKSRETWNRCARTVKLNETAYKIVPSKFKLDKSSRIPGTKLSLELFGEWQTEPYDPPEAKNGIVPRSAYGNVDLFHECMLPKGTVHLRLPGLAKIAAKLNIDCAPAVVGFDIKNRMNIPATDGFIVCSEYESILTEAWEEEQVNRQEREKANREKRIWDNWKRLIRGLMIRRKLKLKYG